MLKLCIATAAVWACLYQPATARERSHDTQIVRHPSGCPRVAFCGCGVSVKVFGRPVRNLYLAANWRRFPSAKAAPGMVAWRYGHVFYIVKMVKRGVALAYDPNSGGHLTRVHLRSVAGYRVVNPISAQRVRGDV